MKRMLTFLLVILLLWGCTPSPVQTIPVYSLYYPQEEVVFFSETGILVSEERSFPEGMDFVKILNQYFQGPVTDGLRNPFPEGLEVLELKYDDSTLSLLLSNAISEPEAMELTLVCCCIAKTCMACLNCDKVVLQGKDALLNDAKSLVLTKDTMLFDETPAITETTK